MKRFGIIGLLALLFFVLGMSSTDQLTQEGYEEQKRSPWDIIGMIAIAIIFAVLVYFAFGFIVMLVGMAWISIKY